MRIHTQHILLALILLTCAQACGDDSPADVVAADCRYTLDPSQVNGQTVECADLNTASYASRALASGEVPVSLHIAAFHVEPKQRTERAWIWILGGPGQSWQEAAKAFSTEVVKNYGEDFLIVDQRGLGQGKPPLECDLSKVPDSADIATAIKTCVDMLRGAHVPIEQYTTWQMAKDIHAAKEYFGYKQLDVLGTSYGTKLALEYLRAYPQDVHGMALDSVSPMQLRKFEHEVLNKNAALDALFLACSQEAGCNARYPNLAADFAQTYNALKTTPLMIDNNAFDGNDFLSTLFDQILSSEAHKAPQFIAQMKQAALSGQPDPTLKAVLMADDSVPYTSNATTWLFYSVTCAENQGVGKDAFTMQATAVRPELTDYANSLGSLLSEVCAAWPVASAPEGAFTPVVNNDVPVLLASGLLDPRTPPAGADLAAMTLGKAQHIKLERAGHSVFSSDGCMLGYAFLFATGRKTAFDPACKEKLEPAFADSL